MTSKWKTCKKIKAAKIVKNWSLKWIEVETLLVVGFF